MMKHYYVYILTNRTNATLYTGVTNDLMRRVYEHRNKLVEGFTKRYQITKLVYYEISEDVLSAIAREKSIKNLVRRKKNLLIDQFNPKWEDLYPKILSG